VTCGGVIKDEVVAAWEATLDLSWSCCRFITVFIGQFGVVNTAKIVSKEYVWSKVDRTFALRESAPGFRAEGLQVFEVATATTKGRFTPDNEGILVAVFECALNYLRG